MSGKNRALRFFMSLVLSLSTITTGILPVSAAGSTFTDVPDDAYYAEAVGWAVDKNITKGTSATTFSPGKGCTRGECVTFLYRYAGTPKADLSNASKFTDVRSDDFYASAVAWAVENGVTSGTSETTFSPKNECTRAQIVTFLWRYKNKPTAGQASTFIDVKGDAYYAGAVSWAVEQNITKGTSDTTFSPENTCTRSQIVTFLYRMDQPSEGNTDDPEIQGGTITDSWTTIIENINNGTYKEKYKIGDTRALDLGSEGVIEMQIAAFDTDELADGSGKAAITWISKQLLKTDRRMNPTREYNSDKQSYVLGTGSIGGWEHSEMRSYLKNDIKPLIPTVVRNGIKSVKKYSSSFYIALDFSQNAVTTDDVWIPSYREVFGTSNSSYESNGPVYSDLFASKSDRMKQKTGTSGASSWWLRSAYNRNGKNYLLVDAEGKISNAANINSVVLGFCTGKATDPATDPETDPVIDEHVQDGRIIDSWEQIIASVNDGSYKNRYGIGDTMALDLGSEGIIDMQIAAFDADELADGSGKASITWIASDLLKTKHRMNPDRRYNNQTYSNSYISGTGSVGGWEFSEMREWLKNDIKPLVPSAVRDSIKPVKKYSAAYDISNNRVNNAVTEDDLWIPSCREVFGKQSESYSSLSFEGEGPMYSELFASSSDRIRKRPGETGYTWWWLRSAGKGSTAFEGIGSGSINDGKIASAEESVAIGFCL